MQQIYVVAWQYWNGLPGEEDAAHLVYECGGGGFYWFSDREAAEAQFEAERRGFNGARTRAYIRLLQVDFPESTPEQITAWLEKHWDSLEYTNKSAPPWPALKVALVGDFKPKHELVYIMSDCTVEAPVQKVEEGNPVVAWDDAETLWNVTPDAEATAEIFCKTCNKRIPAGDKEHGLANDWQAI